MYIYIIHIDIERSVLKGCQFFPEEKTAIHAHLANFIQQGILILYCNKILYSLIHLYLNALLKS